MTEFDPKLVKEILSRRHRRLENNGTHMAMTMYQEMWAGRVLTRDERMVFEDERDYWYKQADRTRKVLRWLDTEIEARRTPAERIWLEIEDDPYDPYNFGIQMVQDVLDAGVRLDILTIKP